MNKDQIWPGFIVTELKVEWISLIPVHMLSLYKEFSQDIKKKQKMFD